jgi:RNA polymerase sigma-70 factor (ECF subfamily)
MTPPKAPTGQANGPDIGPDGLAAIIARYERPLSLYARRLLGSDDAARDAVQETFLQLHAKSPAELNGSLVPWLYTVCRSRAMDLRRKQKRRKETPMTLATEDAIQTLTQADNPADSVEQTDSTTHILKLLTTLPPNQQEVLRLKFQHALSYREIATVTELSESNIGFLIHTALKTIRETLKKTGNL